ncbi:MAG: nucleoside hydrolase [Saprospiraceae bacterium]
MKNLLPLLLFFSFLTITSAQNISFILDADTGNEMDDLYAIVRAVQSPKTEVLALSSAHFNNAQMLTDSLWHIYPTRGIETTKISQELNEELLTALNRTDIPHPIGSKRMLGFGWGYYEGAPIPKAPAIDLMIEKAREGSPTNKLNIVCLGAVSNVATAVITAPEIASNIRVHLLGMRYDFTKAAWDKSEFNARNGINGLNELLNNKQVEMIVMPSNIAQSLQFQRKKSQTNLAESNSKAAPILSRRWDEVNAEESWIMWDLALMEAMINPQFAKLTKRLTPPENTTRFIQVYRDIDTAAIEAAFWEALR